jgi:hypothetical protein
MNNFRLVWGQACHLLADGVRNESNCSADTAQRISLLPAVAESRSIRRAGAHGLAWTPACFKERAYPASRHVRELASEAKGTHGQASLMSQVRAVSGQPSASSILTVVEGAIEVPCRWDELPSETQ